MCRCHAGAPAGHAGPTAPAGHAGPAAAVGHAGATAGHAGPTAPAGHAGPAAAAPLPKERPKSAVEDLSRKRPKSKSALKCGAAAPKQKLKRLRNSVSLGAVEEVVRGSGDADRAGADLGDEGSTAGFKTDWRKFATWLRFCRPAAEVGRAGAAAQALPLAPKQTARPRSSRTHDAR